MSDYDFSALFEKYSDILDQLPDHFTSAEFIQRLAYDHQALYIEALYQFRHARLSGGPAAFVIVNHYLTQKLGDLPGLKQVRADVQFIDMFGKPDLCALWMKQKPGE